MPAGSKAGRRSHRTVREGPSQGSHPEPGGGIVVETRGWGSGPLQARDGRGAVAEREAEAERAQGSGEGGEEDAAAAASAAGTGRSMSGAGLGSAGRARPVPSPAHLSGGRKSGWDSSWSAGVMSSANDC